MTNINFKSIGTIHTPFKKPEGTPIQSIGGKGIKGIIEINDEFIPALKDLNGFSHIILLYYFHRSGSYSPEVIPFMDSVPRGVFSTRAPRRPNPIGFSVVRLKKIQGSTLFIEDIDILDGTPLLDIKPYVPKTDAVKAEKIGWLTENYDGFDIMVADKRFK